MILYDTNVVSEAQHPRGAAHVKARVRETAENASISVVVLGEVAYGARIHPDPSRRRALDAFVLSLRRDFGGRVLPVTVDIAERWADLRSRRRAAGQPISEADALIAATAHVHGLTLWTRNTRDFDDLGIRVFNPWEP